MAELIELGGLWESTDRNGNMVLSGNFGRQGRLVIFKNTFKEAGEKSPDYRLYMDKQQEKEEKNGRPPVHREERAATVDAKDDLPF